jgi:hypothetical protein
LLGRYDSFPENLHSIALLATQAPQKSLQQSIFRAFHRLNNETFGIGALTPYLKQDCEVGFEFGVADGVDFVFLDQNELEQCLTAVKENELKVLDFFVVVRYHTTKKENKKVPLRFDYHVIRFIFNEDQTELRIRHEKGPQRVPLSELTDFLVDQINNELYGAQLAPLVLNGKNKVRIEFSD